MEEVSESPFSMTSLGDELSCSICLSPFDCPVTLPCGHNFCQDCLLQTWKDSYSCPKCRTHFATRPELKKNTVLSTVVETFTLRSSQSESSPVREEQTPESDVIRCDTCMEAEASQTCLTCMASFCEEHLRPHRENPIFRVHQLSEPVGDLSERICPDHHKLMELFCSQHGRPICSLCLQQVHKGCSFTSPEEQRSLRESVLRNKLGLLEEKIEKTEAVLCQMNETQCKLKDGASKRKTVLASVYQQMRDMLAQEERKAQLEVDCELEVGQTKLRDLVKRFNDNTEIMRKSREDINCLLSQSQTLDFLQASFNLPKLMFEPHAPRINLDSEKVTATQAFAAALRESLTEILNQPVEARLPIVKGPEPPEPNVDVAASDEEAVSASYPARVDSVGPRPEPERHDPPEQKTPPASGPPLIQTYYQPIPVPVFSYMGPRPGWNPSHYARGPAPGFSRAPPFKAAQKTKPKKTEGESTKKTVGEKKEKKDACMPVHKVPPSTAGEKPQKPATVKKGDTSRQTGPSTSHPTPPKQDKKKPGAPGPRKPGTTDSSKNDKPKSCPPSKKSTGHHPHSKK